MSTPSSVEMTTAEVARQIVQSTKRSSIKLPAGHELQQQQSQQRHKPSRKKMISTTTTLEIEKNQDYDDDDRDDLYIGGDTSWSEVCRTCFVHSPQEWLTILPLIAAFFACLYVFGLGLDFLSSGAKVMAGCFGSSVNPVAGVMVGILATVLLQSSSTTTSIVVALVGADDSLFTVDQGIYMIMGANIGTTVTNTIVALLQFPNQTQLADAFAGATVHDMFNFLTCAILLPLEIATGYLHRLTGALVQGSNTESGDSWQGPVKQIISPLGKKILIANKGVTNAVAGGGSCDDFYPIICDDPDNPSYDTCGTVGLIGCDKSTGHCPAFFDANANVVEDQSAGLVVLCMGIFVCFIALVALVQVLTRLLTGVSIRVIHKATNLNGYVLILIGTGVTTMLQSSSTTVSFLTPIAGIGALRLDQMYPLTIGANIGTTITAVLAAMVTDGNSALQVALAHLMFNMTGFLIWYPILALRNVPIAFARRLGQYVRVWRPFAVVYLFGAFFALPLIGLGLSALFLEGSFGYTLIASLLTALVGILLVFTIRWCYFRGGRAIFHKYLLQKHQRYVTLQTLTTDMERIKKQMNYHCEYAGIDIHAQPPRRSTKTSTSLLDESVALEDGEEQRRRSSSAAAPDVEGYADKKAKHDKKLREAMTTVTQDMDYLKAGLTVLNHHTGMWAEEEDEDDGSTGSSEQDAEAQEPSNSTTQKLVAQEEEKVNLAILWQEVPRVYVFAFVAASALTLWGIIALFLHGGKASIGAAYFLLSVFLISVVWGGIVFNPNYLHEYFRNLDRAKRDETINALPRDMKVLKLQLKRLLQHYKLLQVEDLLGSWNDTNTNTSQSSP
eukprot:CAMPEP_0117066914 /NCGR_PEP_ID=MMETSP0472-20121206/46819_1 /TAXON_ID=693140 ORGANISM="Tiarina fusus, Strain LIS" /NCGR_SAMPLE_ID=MMETSP0472 /ASSEMBLY_ACC=CAM_ASM_000603 /LENGTH=840 /DNA_ID=CAMNT_0004788209 /DNA_START=210 /DNA_END=2732 /DNA_ORIENTATION=-